MLAINNHTGESFEFNDADGLRKIIDMAPPGLSFDFTIGDNIPADKAPLHQMAIEYFSRSKPITPDQIRAEVQHDMADVAYAKSLRSNGNNGNGNDDSNDNNNKNDNDGAGLLVINLQRIMDEHFGNTEAAIANEVQDIQQTVDDIQQTVDAIQDDIVSLIDEVEADAKAALTAVSRARATMASSDYKGPKPKSSWTSRYNQARQYCMDHKRKVGMTALGVVSLIAGSVILYKAHQADKKNEVLTLNMASQPLVHHGEAGQKEQHQVTKSPQHQAFYELRQARRYIRIAKVSGYSLQAIGVFTIIVA